MTRRSRKSREREEAEIADVGLEPETKAAKKPSWKSDREWWWIASDSRLEPRERKVKGSYSGIMYNIIPNGAWVWRPDAEKILKLQGLASCRGSRTLNTPFGKASPCRVARLDKPQGPPRLK